MKRNRAVWSTRPLLDTLALQTSAHALQFPHGRHQTRYGHQRPDRRLHTRVNSNTNPRHEARQARSPGRRSRRRSLRQVSPLIYDWPSRSTHQTKPLQKLRCRLSELFSYPALSRFGHGDLCSDCGRRSSRVAPLRSVLTDHCPNSSFNCCVGRSNGGNHGPDSSRSSSWIAGCLWVRRDG